MVVKESYKGELMRRASKEGCLRELQRRAGIGEKCC